MVFSSVIFIFCFLPATLILYYLTKNEIVRNLVLLISSLSFYFYGEQEYTSVMLLAIFIGWFFGLQIEKSIAQSRKLFLKLGLVITVGVLLVFKYTNFFVDVLNSSLQILQVPFQFNVTNVHLPIGVSFFTFQVVSYLVDVYRRDVQAQKSILKMGVYKSFFPQLIAGPIVRYKEVAGELTGRNVTVSDLSYGIRRFIWGLALKVLIADCMGNLADRIYGTPIDHLTPLLAWTAAIAYYFQIFFDFSGYSHMAIGMARMFGFHFPENFNSPYISRSVTEFWSRWHMTLSLWMRDYIYIPLGGNRTSSARQSVNVMITFLISGFWHGAAFTFIAWGLFHGTLVVIEKYFLLKIYKKIPSFITLLITNFFVILGWVIFRSDSIGQATSVFELLFGLRNGNPLWLPMSSLINREVLFTLVLALLFVRKNWFEKLILHDDDSKELSLLAQFSLLSSVIALLVVSLSYLASSTFNPFIYYRF